MIWSAPKAWPGETCFILAGGPSLRKMDLEFLKTIKGKARVIAINDSWRLAPQADVLYFCDGAWWQRQMAANAGILTDWKMDYTQRFHDLIYRGYWVTASPGFESHPQVRCMRLTGERGLELDPMGLRHGHNSGYQAINLACHFGASRIVLLGYDMKCIGVQTHWHLDGQTPTPVFQTALTSTMLPMFTTLMEPLKEAKVQVVNSTPDSALTCWEYQPLTEVLESLELTQKEK